MNLQPSITQAQKKTALKFYKEHLMDNCNLSELAEMVIKYMPAKELQSELENVVELCDIEPDGTY